MSMTDQDRNKRITDILDREDYREQTPRKLMAAIEEVDGEARGLLPCPFCGGDTHVADTGVVWIICNDCGAEGPPRDDIIAAIAAWNLRVVSAQDVRGQAHRDAISPSGGLTSVEAHRLAQCDAAQAAREHVAGLIADLQGEHEVMAGPFDPTAWKLEVPVVHLQALLGVHSQAAVEPAQDARDQIEIREGITDGYCDIINQTKKTTIGRVQLWNGTAQDLRDIFGPATLTPAGDDWQAMCEAERRFSAKQAAEIVRLSGELSQASAQVSELEGYHYVAEAHIAQLEAQVEDAGTRPRNFLAWAVGMFGPVAKLRSERLMRFVEEAIELAHADGMERVTLDAIASRVYGRERGEIRKEIGQAQACLETYAENIGESASSLAEIEWQRVQRIPSEEWQRRHKAKQDIGIALSHSSTELQGETK